VNERWVCKRCFADNEDTAPTCARCGLARGSEVSDADRTAWAAETGTPLATEPPAWRRWLRFWWIPAIAIFLAVGYLSSARRAEDGSVNAGGTLQIDDLRVGDCFNNADEGEISDVDGVPCTEAHEYEVFAMDRYESETLPTDAEMDAVFFDVCATPFEEYVGISWERSVLWANMITPSEGSFGDGDRSYVCFLFDPEEPALTESMRGAAR
jgi:hypothetical protein